MESRRMPGRLEEIEGEMPTSEQDILRMLDELTGSGVGEGSEMSAPLGLVPTFRTPVVHISSDGIAV